MRRIRYWLSTLRFAAFVAVLGVLGLGGCAEDDADCLMEMSDADAPAGFGFGGTHTLTGNVILPAGFQSSFRAQITVMATNVPEISWSVVKPERVGSCMGRVAYVVRDLPRGDFAIRFRADGNGDGTLESTTRDLDGWSGGTVDMPATQLHAVPTTITDADVTAPDFGVGLYVAGE